MCRRRASACRRARAGLGARRRCSHRGAVTDGDLPRSLTVLVVALDAAAGRALAARLAGEGVHVITSDASDPAAAVAAAKRTGARVALVDLDLPHAGDARRPLGPGLVPRHRGARVHGPGRSARAPSGARAGRAGLSGRRPAATPAGARAARCRAGRARALGGADPPAAARARIAARAANGRWTPAA